MSITHADFTIERRYAWTPQQVFAAFSDPELKRQWFANPGDRPDAEWELDFRVGGRELSTSGELPDGSRYTFRSRYHDIVENERVVFAYDLLRDDRLISVSLTTVEFLALGDGTRLMFTEQGAFFDGLDDPAEREHGTGKLLDALERFLAREPVR
jgi:uncharacterized protein YndB with AHSA1/START domain